MTARFATNDDITKWNSIIQKNPDKGNFFQMNEFADIKQASGWTPRYIISDTVSLLVLEKSVFNLGKLWYVPKGPGVTTVNQLAAVTDDLKILASKESVFTIKIEPEIERQNASRTEIIKLGMTVAADAQPTFSTIIIDISNELDAIIASFDGKARYNIRQAEKAGVTCQEVEATDENCRIFYDIFTETASGRFGIRPFEYYRRFWQTYCKSGAGKMLFAYLDNTVISADFLMILGTKGSRKDAASPKQKSVRGAAAILEVEAIRVLKQAGVTSYDLCGSPPSDRIKDQSHPLYGIGQFKSSFSQNVIDFIGTYEIPIKKTQARLWASVVERVVRRLHYKRQRESYY